MKGTKKKTRKEIELKTNIAGHISHAHMFQIGQMGYWAVPDSVTVTVKRRHCVGDGFQHVQNHRQHPYQLLSRRQHPHTQPYSSGGVS